MLPADPSSALRAVTRLRGGDRAVTGRGQGGDRAVTGRVWGWGGLWDLFV